MATKTLLTAEDFAKLPEDDFELVDGELVSMPSPTIQHTFVKDELLVRLKIFLRRARLGEIYSEMDCRLSEFTIRRPDLSFFTAERIRNVDPSQSPVPIAPDLAIEVLSPSEGAMEVNRKAMQFLAAGTREVWILDPAIGEIVVRSSSGGRFLGAQDTLRSDLLPGFEVAVSDIFRVPDQD